MGSCENIKTTSNLTAVVYNYSLSGAVGIYVGMK